MATLPAGETFLHPTVTQVIFQLRFPKLFFLQSKIGELQLELMSRFPKSESVVQRALFIAQGPHDKLQELLKERPNDEDERIWTFEDDGGLKVEVKLDSLTVVSTKHKSYRNEVNSFRDNLQFIVGVFLKHAPLQRIARVGFRYVDECPFPSLTNDCFLRYFNSCLPLDRFRVHECSEMACRANRVSDVGSLRYVEGIFVKGTRNILLIDMDAYAEEVLASDILTTTDGLHTLIRREFEGTVKEPVLAYMRTGVLQP
jgi:uncharacterized protein (TIGR04255 family)